MDNILLADIETKINEKFIELVPLPELKKTPSNYKDLSKIDAFRKQALKDQETEFNNQVERMALDIDFARICCIGMATNFTTDTDIVSLCHNEKEETEVLRKFWKYAYGKNLIGYNIIHFDLPIIIRRSLILGVKPSFFIDQNRMKYNDYITDLMLKLYNGGYVTNMNSKKPFARKAEMICKILGIENPMPGIDGSMVAKMSDEELIKYNANDIFLLQRLAKKTKNYYW